MRGHRLLQGFTIVAYALPAAVVWGLIGVFVGPLVGHPLVLVFGSIAYALGFGIIEAFQIPFWRPGLAWQVPAKWVRGKPLTRILIWGSLLGPGLVTRNPYASMWLLLPFIALAGQFMPAVAMGVLVGASHGCMRAVGVLRNQHRTGGQCSPFTNMIQQAHWRQLDGLGLLLIAGLLVAYVATLLIP